VRELSAGNILAEVRIINRCEANSSIAPKKKDDRRAPTYP
jgi:hypothetical protein